MTVTGAEPGTPVERRSWVEQVMGLPVSVLVRGRGARGGEAEAAVAAVYAGLRRADRVFSTYRPDSQVSLLRRGVLVPELASPEVREVLELCGRARELTGGLFDADLPQRDGGRLLDPSGLVKGWAVERAAGALHGLPDLDWLVNAGGDIVGRARHGPPWRIAVEDPRDRTGVVCVLPLAEGAVATSGTGARGRHILDPRTGRPASDALLSTTVIGPSLTWADVLATALFVGGVATLERIERLAGYEALVADRAGRLHGTPGAVRLLAQAPT